MSSKFCNISQEKKWTSQEDAVKDAERRVLEAKISMTARLYANANGNKGEVAVTLSELSIKFLESGGTTDQLDALINEQ